MINAPVPPPGSVIAGKYRVERVLGSGGMAVVVEATHMVLGQRVAIKLLRADVVDAEGVVERFRQEAQIAAQLAGDHIVRVTDVGQAEAGEPYIVMELLVGRDLEAELLARGALPVDEAVDILLQACEGVAEAHAAGLIHRDLKPGNLFLTRRRDGSPHVKVLDFGISKLTRGEASLALTQTTKDTFGTPLYMSPEQIQSSKHVDPASDQHALGAILYTLLAACPPFVAPSVTALSVVIATQPPPSLRDVRGDVPVRLDAAVARALAKKSSDRFRDLAELAHAIAPFGGIGSDAAVRRIASTLAYARTGQGYEHAAGPVPAAAPSGGGVIVSPSAAGHAGASGYPPPSGPGAPPPYGAPPGYGAPPAYGSSPGYGGASGYGGAPAGYSGTPAYGTPAYGSPGYSAPPGYGVPPGFPVAPPRQLELGPPRGGQTSAELTTAVGERAASQRKAPFALVIVGAMAVTVAVLVTILLVGFGRRRGAESAASTESAAPIAASAAPSGPSVEASAAPMDSSAPADPAASASGAPSPSASGAPSDSALAAASAAPTTTSTTTAPATSTAPPPYVARSYPATTPTAKGTSTHAAPRPSASTKSTSSTSTTKKVDPAKVFGAKR